MSANRNLETGEIYVSDFLIKIAGVNMTMTDFTPDRRFNKLMLNLEKAAQQHYKGMLKDGRI